MSRHVCHVSYTTIFSHIQHSTFPQVVRYYCTQKLVYVYPSHLWSNKTSPTTILVSVVSWIFGILWNGLIFLLLLNFCSWALPLSSLGTCLNQFHRHREIGWCVRDQLGSQQSLQSLWPSCTAHWGGRELPTWRGAGKMAATSTPPCWGVCPPSPISERWGCMTDSCLSQSVVMGRATRAPQPIRGVGGTPLW